MLIHCENQCRATQRALSALLRAQQRPQPQYRSPDKSPTGHGPPHIASSPASEFCSRFKGEQGWEKERRRKSPDLKGRVCETHRSNVSRLPLTVVRALAKVELGQGAGQPRLQAWKGHHPSDGGTVPRRIIPSVPTTYFFLQKGEVQQGRGCQTSAAESSYGQKSLTKNQG